MSLLQKLQSMRRQLVHQLYAYQLAAAIITRLSNTQTLSRRTRQLLTSVERSTSGVGIYLVLCKLDKMILLLSQRAGQSIGSKSLCVDHGKSVDEMLFRLKKFPAGRVQAAYSAAVLSVSVRRLLSVDRQSTQTRKIVRRVRG